MSPSGPSGLAARPRFVLPLLIPCERTAAHELPAEKAARYKRMSQEAEQKGLAEPFKGITTKGTLVEGLFRADPCILKNNIVLESFGEIVVAGLGGNENGFSTLRLVERIDQGQSSICSSFRMATPLCLPSLAMTGLEPQNEGVITTWSRMMKCNRQVMPLE